MSRSLLVCLPLVFSACTLLPVPVTTTAMMDDKDPPAKIEMTDWGIPYYTYKNRLAWWSEAPTWGEVQKRELTGGRWQVTRYSTNLPLVRVLIDDTLTGKKCRWSSVRLLQQKKVSDPSDVAFSSETEIDTDFVDEQFAGSCQQIKQTIINDPNYSAVIAKD
jgi:hypothetical protein